MPIWDSKDGKSMIIEVLGTGGAGKSTLEPLLAARIGIAHFGAGKRRDLDGVLQGPAAVWTGRIAAIGTNPILFASAFTAIPSSLRNRLWFATDLCRRERNARIAAGRGSGVLASGSLHALAQGSARFGADLGDLVVRIIPADVYVRLRLDADAAATRLADRRQVGPERIGDHRAWTTNYEAVLDSALARLGVPVVEAEALGSPDEIAADVAARTRALHQG